MQIDYAMKMFKAVFYIYKKILKQKAHKVT